MSEPRMVFANDLPYTDRDEDWRESMHSAIVFDAADWSGSRGMAWVYGILIGWDCEEDHEHDWICGGTDGLDDMGPRFRWDEANIARLRRLRLAYLAERETRR